LTRLSLLLRNKGVQHDDVKGPSITEFGGARNITSRGHVAHGTGFKPQSCDGPINLATASYQNGVRRSARRQKRSADPRHRAAFERARDLTAAVFDKTGTLTEGRFSTPHAIAFCEKHKISFDWLLCGDLQGLHRMTKEAKADPPEMTEAQRKEVTRLFLALSPQKQAIALVCMRELMARSLPNG
jgi:hypothetical protein